MSASNRETLAVSMIETVSALEQVEESAKLPGLDVLFIGPYDLSLALGIIEQFENPIFLNAIDRVVAAAMLPASLWGFKPAICPCFSKRGGVAYAF